MKLDEALKKLYPRFYKSSFQVPDYSNSYWYAPYNGPKVKNKSDVNDLFKLYLEIKKRYPKTSFVTIDSGSQVVINSVKKAIPHVK